MGRRFSIAGGFFAVALLVGACTGSGSALPEAAGEPTREGSAVNEDVTASEATAPELESEPEVEGVEWSSHAQEAASDIELLLTAMIPTWDGFDPADHPTVVLLAEDDGSITTGFTVNHPAPTAVGSVSPVDGQDGVLYVSEFASTIDRPGNGFFGRDVEIGGVPSYVIVTDSTNEFAPAGSEIWRGLFMHEMFHLHQTSWTNRRFIDQDGNLYDYSVDNLELALLEDAALVAAVDAPTPDEASQALEHFVALRAVRLESFASTELDEQQEAIEGTAQWFEWRSIGREAPFYGGPAVGTSLDDPGGISGDPRIYLAFRRFYLTGGTIMELLDRRGIDWLEPIETGAKPAEVLRDAVVVDPADHAALIDQARQRYDVDGQLSGLAQRWSEAATEATAAPDSEEPADGG